MSNEVSKDFFEYGSSFPVPKSDYNMYYRGCVSLVNSLKNEII